MTINNENKTPLSPADPREPWSALQVPSPEELASVQALCSIRDPYLTSDETADLFASAMREVTAWHVKRSEFYRNLFQSKNIDLDELKSPSDFDKLPPVIANFFKYHKILSVPEDKIKLHATSSGTTGQKSQIFFDEWSIGSAQRMVDDIFAYYDWVTPSEVTNYLLYSYEPRPGFNLGTSITDNFLLKYAPTQQVVYALRNTGNGQHEFDLFGTIRALLEFAAAGKPVRIFGFPAFMHFTLKKMRDLGVGKIKLHPQSLTFFGGGWKGAADQEIKKSDLYEMISDQLGIPDARIRDGFGSVEHCVPYVECSHHNFHVPVWARVIIRDLATLAPLGYGEAGYLNFISPYITSVPAHSVLMTDLAILYPGDACGCGIKTDWFALKGRAGLSKNKSCAVAAAELLKAGGSHV